MECIDSIALPTSTVRIPILDNIGPTVEPQILQQVFTSDLAEVTDWSRIDVHVIATFKILHSSALPIDKLLHQETSNGIGCVFLFRIRLENYTTVHHWLVVVLVLGRVIWMHRVGHICTDQE